jgi:adenylate kinase
LLARKCGKIYKENCFLEDMKLIFVGPQGSGKGTQAKIVSKELGIAHISTGDLLREATGELREEIDSYIVGGNLVPDELILKILKERVAREDCEKGFILDGFPRNMSQAEALDRDMKMDKVIEISISDEESVNRILGRRPCPKCGILWNVRTSPKPKVETICDECGAELVKRDDDNEESLRKRLEIYHNDTEPILEHYDSVRINGEQSIEQVSEDVLKVLR